MYKFSSAGKAIARGDDMKKPNKFLNKKSISSLVIAAFLILSVLTAYNIRFGNNGPETAETEVEETIGNNDDVISSGDARMEDEQEGVRDRNVSGENNEKNNEDDAESVGETEEDESENRSGRDAADQEDEGRSSDDTSEEEEEQNADLSHFSYDGNTKMPWPVVGNVILPYSMDTTVYYTTLDQYACNDGILIGAKKGQEVTAVADGRIVNIAESDRYGTTVTMVIGKYYEVSYSQVENVNFKIGDEVEEGDVIATVAEPTRSFTLEGPHLFFKMTYKGEPVNPTDYLEE